MFKAKLEEKRLQQINKDLLNGTSLKDVAEKNSVSYQHACYYRKKLVKAGVLTPLYEKRKTRKKRTARFTVRKSTPTVPLTNVSTFRVSVNDTEINILGAKHVNVYPDRVDVKY